MGQFIIKKPSERAVRSHELCDEFRSSLNGLPRIEERDQRLHIVGGLLEQAISDDLALRALGEVGKEGADLASKIAGLILRSLEQPCSAKDSREILRRSEGILARVLPFPSKKPRPFIREGKKRRKAKLLQEMGHRNKDALAKPTVNEKSASKYLQLYQFLCQLAVFGQMFRFCNLASERNPASGPIRCYLDPRENETIRDILLEFQRRVPSNLFHPSWNTQEKAWLRGIEGNPTLAKLASSLINLEDYLEWDVMYEGWPSIRPMWKAELVRLRQEMTGDQPLSDLISRQDENDRNL
jgi:hypothetical protein